MLTRLRRSRCHLALAFVWPRLFHRRNAAAGLAGRPITIAPRIDFGVQRADHSLNQPSVIARALAGRDALLVDADDPGSSAHSWPCEPSNSAAWPHRHAPTG